MKIIIKMNKTEQLCTILNIDMKKRIKITIEKNSNKRVSVMRKKPKNKEKIKKYNINNTKSSVINNFFAQSIIYCSPKPCDLPLPVFD